ncbi:MAG TPA: hypothetical protein VFX45_11760 [Solirubrobacterales bacterium]|nr:hypothetical protein [Solirubrobacterales bacterium]
MDAQTSIELAALAATVIGGAWAVWRVKSDRWKLVSAISSAAGTYLARSGSGARERADRSEATTAAIEAAERAKKLNSPGLDKAAGALVALMQKRAEEKEVRKARKKVRRRRWL